MGGGDADDVRRVERIHREFNRLHIQPQGTTQQFNFNPLVFQPQATLFARCVHVGGLPPSANEQTIAVFFNQVMVAIGGNTAGPGDAVVSVCTNHEQRFTLVEFRAAEEASNATALDGILFEGAPVKVGRPADYNLSQAAGLGPTMPSRKLNLAAVGLDARSDGGLEGPDRIFVGGLPYYFTEANVRELLESFGPLRGFELVKDRETGNSKGYAFCVYQDLTVTAIACAALNGIKMGDKNLTVRRANQGTSKPRSEQESILLQAQQQVQLGGKLNHAVVGLARSAGGLESPDRIFVGGLAYFLTEAQVRELLESFGPLRGFELVKDRETGDSKGYAFCVYMDTNVTDIVCAALNGIKFGDKTLTVRRANQGASQPSPEHRSILLQARQQVQMQKLANAVAAAPTKVVCLVQVVNAYELQDDEEYENIKNDMGQEACRYGNLVKVVIPRPDPSGHPVNGVGNVFLEYVDVYSASRAKMALHGRKFDGEPVVANYYPDSNFANLDFDG